MSGRPIAVAACVLAFAARTPAADPPATQPAVRFALPDGWTQRTAANGRIMVTAPGPDGLKMQIAAKPLPDGKPMDDKLVAYVVDKMVTQAKMLSVETDLPLTQFDGSFTGQYFTCTSKKQKGPVEKQFVNTVFFAQGQGTVLNGSITHRRTDKDVDAAIEAVRSAKADTPPTP